MLFRNYFNGMMLLLFLLMSHKTIMASVIKEQCGNDLFIVKVSNEFDIFERKFELYYRVNDREKIFYKTKPGVALFTACVQNKKQQLVLLFQESYGGNVGPEDMYGIFDPVRKKMLITPSDWPKGNRAQVKQILGYFPPFISDDDGTFFCCFRRQFR